MSNEFYSVHMLIQDGVAQGNAYDAQYMYLDDYLELIIGISNEENQ